MIVEDDAVIANSVSKHLEKWDYDARCVKDFQLVMDFFHEFVPDLILMDITLPYCNGFFWCSETC